MRRGGGRSALCVTLLLGTVPVAGAGVAQWEFNGNLDSATGGAALVAEFVPPAVEPVTEFVAMEIDGSEAQVARFSQGTVFRMTHGLGANGGGQFLNLYTLIMDVMFPAERAGFTSLWQTNEGNGNDGEWFIHGDGGLGISGNYGGAFTNAEWHRLALVIDSGTGMFTSFLDGAQVQQLSTITVDGRWSVGATALVFADDSQENWEGYINSLQIRYFAMTADEVAALAGAQAAGIPIPVDECEPASAAEDCNGNNVKDSCDLRKGTSHDCDGDLVPDECQIEADPAKDCDKNDVLDACEVEKLDCNGNGIVDACDIASGLLKDCNLNGIPDSCEIGVARWDFDGDLTEAGGGEELLPFVTLPAVEAEFTFEQADIGGEEAQVALFTRGTAFQLTHDLGSNGGGEGLNRYTLLMDVMFPDRSASGGWAVLFQTEPANADDGEWFINPDGGVGISGNYGGMAGDGMWHRLAVVVDLAKGTFTSYVDGIFAQTNQTTDARFTFPQTAFLFADQSQENAAGYVNSVQLRRYPMSEQEVAALGGASAAGIPTNDCNRNNAPDACDIAAGTSQDVDTDGVPDECEGPVATLFKRGDTNADRNINIADAVFVLGYLFAQKPEATCMKTTDANNDKNVNIADAVFILGYLFAKGQEPAPPFAACGTDPNPNTITCVRFEPCE